jgi:predicted AAA+ superfamily ATPase
MFPLQPYYVNFGKRLTKKPKLYFYDTGLAASLLGLSTAAELGTHYLRGHLFENAVLSEMVKKTLNSGCQPAFYYWRENESREIDVLKETADGLTAWEIKASQTANTGHIKHLLALRETLKLKDGNSTVIYDGPDGLTLGGVRFVNWRNIAGG